jgi:hypothetical protein
VEESHIIANHALWLTKLLMAESSHQDPQWPVLCGAAAHFMPSVLDSCFALLGRLDKPTLSAAKSAGRGGSSRSNKHRSGGSKAGGGSIGRSAGSNSTISDRDRVALVSTKQFSVLRQFWLLLSA